MPRVGEASWERELQGNIGMAVHHQPTVEEIKDNLYTAIDEIKQSERGKIWKEENVHKKFAEMTVKDGHEFQPTDECDLKKTYTSDIDETLSFHEDILKKQTDIPGSGKVWDNPNGSPEYLGVEVREVKCDVLEKTPVTQPMDVDHVNQHVEFNHTAETERMTQVNTESTKDVAVTEDTQDSSTESVAEEDFATFMYSGDFLEGEEHPDIYLADTVPIEDVYMEDRAVYDRKTSVHYVEEHEYDQAVSKLTSKVRQLKNEGQFNAENLRLILAAVVKLPTEPTQENLHSVSTIDTILEKLVTAESVIDDSDKNWLRSFVAALKDTHHVGFTKAEIRFQNQVSMCEEITKKQQAGIQVTDGNFAVSLSQNNSSECLPKNDKVWKEKHKKRRREDYRRKVTKKFMSKTARPLRKPRRSTQNVNKADGLYLTQMSPRPGQITYSKCEDLKEFLHNLNPKENTIFQSGIVINKNFLAKGQFSFEKDIHYTFNRFGKGSYGTVDKCSLLRFDMEFVIKRVVNKIHFNTFEVTVPLELQHDNIVKIYGFINRPTGYEIVMEYAGISLEMVIKQKNNLGDNGKSEVFYQVLDAVAYLHKKYVYHRDIKPQNIAIKILDNGQFKATLIDFGACITDSSPPGVREMTPVYIPWELCKLLAVKGQNVAGFCGWDLVDGYALGCVLVFMESGRHVWMDSYDKNKPLLKHIAENPKHIRYEVYQKCSPTFMNIALALTNPNTACRMSPTDMIGKIRFISGVLHLQQDHQEGMSISLHDDTPADAENTTTDIPDFENLL